MTDLVFIYESVQRSTLENNTVRARISKLLTNMKECHWPQWRWNLFTASYVRKPNPKANNLFKVTQKLWQNWKHSLGFRIQTCQPNTFSFFQRHIKQFVLGCLKNMFLLLRFILHLPISTSLFFWFLRKVYLLFWQAQISFSCCKFLRPFVRGEGWSSLVELSCYKPRFNYRNVSFRRKRLTFVLS